MQEGVSIVILIVYYIHFLSMPADPPQRGVPRHTGQPVDVPPTRHILQEFIYICVSITIATIATQKYLTGSARKMGSKLQFPHFWIFKIAINCNKIAIHVWKIATKLQFLFDVKFNFLKITIVQF